MFTLDPILQRDTITLGDFPLAQLLLMNDSNYPWFILVPRREGVSEIYQLSAPDQQQLLQESSYLARQLAEAFQADKMNIAALGNVVKQLHLHHIVRYRDDAVWPAPVWGKLEPLPYTQRAIDEIKHKLAGCLREGFSAC